MLKRPTDQWGVVHDGVAVVDTVNLQGMQGGVHVLPRHTKLPGMGGGFQAVSTRQRIHVGKFFGRMVVFAVVHANARHIVRAQVQHPLQHFQCSVFGALPVNRRNQAGDDAKVMRGITHGPAHGRQHLCVS